MKDIQLPDFKAPEIPPKRISMSAYLRFVLFGNSIVKDRDRVLEARLNCRPRTRFSLVTENHKD